MPLIYKVLNENMTGPYMGCQWELGVPVRCENFGAPGQNGCRKAIYAGETVESLLYANLAARRKAFIGEGIGNRLEEGPFKIGFEEVVLHREATGREIREKAREEGEMRGYNIEEALFPINPLLLPKIEIEDRHIRLLKEWDSVGWSVRSSVLSSVWDSVGWSVWDSVRSSVRRSVRQSVEGSVGWSVRSSVLSSVWDSVWDSVGWSVWDSVRSSVWDSVWDSVDRSVIGSVRWSVMDSVGWSVRSLVNAYISSLFPEVYNWKYIEHEPGVNPFRSGIELWKEGFVPSYDGQTWRLHQGPKAEVVYEWEP